MKEVRKWEDLDCDCLANILGRVGIESLLLDVPFVCKSWHKATFNPLCWQNLHISSGSVFKNGSCDTPFVHRFVQEFRIENFSLGGFISLLVPRGLGKSASRVLTKNFDPKDLECVADKCPGLKSISLSWHVLVYRFLVVRNVLGKLTHLEELEVELAGTVDFDAIAAEIGKNCIKCSSVIVRSESFEWRDGSAIADHLPKIKKLGVICNFLDTEGLESILRSCKDLEYVVVTTGRDLEEEEKRRLKELAAHVKTFNLKSKTCKK